MSARSLEARRGSGAAVVVLLRGCQAMASLNAKAAGPNANEGRGILPALSYPGTEKQWGEEVLGF